MNQVQFYSYRLHLHDTNFPSLHIGGHLFQQYLCDIWVSSDQNWLCWVQHNQPCLCAALYSGLEDAVSHHDDALDLNSIGRHVILPSSYVGGPRYMNQRFQDTVGITMDLTSLSHLLQIHLGLRLLKNFCRARSLLITQI